MSNATPIRESGDSQLFPVEVDTRLEALDVLVQEAFESVTSDRTDQSRTLALLNVAMREIESLRALAVAQMEGAA